MKSDVLQRLFFEARASLLLVRRVSLLVALILMLFYVGFFSQYLRTLGSKARLDVEQTRIKVAVEQTSLASQQLRQLSEKVKGIVATNTKTCLEGLRKDFLSFDQMILATLMDADVRGRFDSGESSHAQQAQVSVREVRGLPALPESVVHTLRGQVDGVKLRRMLSPYVVQHIIERNFLKLNDDLNQELAALFGRELPRLREYLRAGSQVMVKEGTAFEDLEEALSVLDSYEVRVDIPRGDWWKTVESKVAMLDALGESAFESIHQHLNAVGLERVALTASNAAAELDALSQQLNDTQGSLEASFEDYKRQLAKWASLFGVVAIELHQVVMWFPLLLSAISVTLLFSYGVCRKKLGSLVHLAHQRGALDQELVEVLQPGNSSLVFWIVLLGTAAWVVVAGHALLVTPSIGLFFCVAEVLSSLLLLCCAGWGIYLARGKGIV